MAFNFAVKQKISAEEYLQSELYSDIKHELIDGEVYAMAGASTNHNRLVINFVAAFSIHLRNTPCEPFAADMKVRVEDSFFYPDVSVACEHAANDYGITDAPLIIIEVLSRATRKTDHTLKRLAYQRLASLQEYVLIEQDIVDVEICRRSNSWRSEHYYLGDEAYFAAIDLHLPVAAIYERVANEDMQLYLMELTKNA